jgi:GNAT superfamily N-acetyltransferase
VRSLEPFKGDVAALGAFMADAWSDDPGAFLYDAEFMATMLTCPGAGPPLSPTVYEDGAIAGFGCGVPGRLRLGGRSLPAITSSFLSVAKDRRRSGLGPAILADLVKQARAQGFEAMLQFCVEGGPMNAIVLGLGQALGFATWPIFRVAYLSRMVFPPKPGAIEEDDEGDAVELLLRLGGEAGAGQGLAKLWSEAEARWTLGRTHAVSTVVRRDGRAGMLTGSLMRLARQPDMICLVLEDLLWGDLNGEERGDLVRAMLAKASARGARMASAPVLGYADTAPLLEQKFRPSNRVLHAYLSDFTGAAAPATLSSLYVDVF